MKKDCSNPSCQGGKVAVDIGDWRKCPECFPSELIESALERIAIMGENLTEREYLAFIRGVSKALAKQMEAGK